MKYYFLNMEMKYIMCLIWMLIRLINGLIIIGQFADQWRISLLIGFCYCKRLLKKYRGRWPQATHTVSRNKPCWINEQSHTTFFWKLFASGHLPHTFPHKNCVWWTAFATQFLLRTMCDTFNNANDLTGKLCVMYLWTETFSLERLCGMYIRTETFGRDWLCVMYL